MTRRVWTWIWAGGILGIGIADLVALQVCGVDCTLSRFALDWPPAVVFGVGYAMQWGI